jgi:hypothetical protein
MAIDIRELPIKVIRQKISYGQLQPPEERSMLLGDRIKEYIELFGILPLSIRTVIQNLLVRGKIYIEYDDGSNERIQLENPTTIMSEADAVTALGIYSDVEDQKTAVGKNITQRVMVQPMHKPKRPEFKR